MSQNCGTDEQLVRLLIRDEIKNLLANGNLQAALKGCDGSSLDKNDTVATCAQVDGKVMDALAKLDISGSVTRAINDSISAGTLQAGLKRCDGTTLTKGLTVPTCDQLQDGIASIPKIVSSSVNCATHTITLTYSDGTTFDIDATCLVRDDIHVNSVSVTDNVLKVKRNDDTEFTATLPTGGDGNIAFTLSTTIPATTETTSLSYVVTGDRSVLMGKPSAYAEVEVGGIARLIPLYDKPTAPATRRSKTSATARIPLYDKPTAPATGGN